MGGFGGEGRREVESAVVDRRVPPRRDPGMTPPIDGGVMAQQPDGVTSQRPTLAMHA